MKDKVFLIWSGNNTVALKVKQVLESQYNYVCDVGGNSDNNSSFASIGDTIIQQMKSCNQAIVLFQNRDDGMLSFNLFFELGYVSASYGMKKVHCVRRENEEITLPSDFDNAFVEALPSPDDDTYVEEIIEYFMQRQKMSVDVNKMQLINNRYLIHNMLQSHYSDSGSLCSDYELAQYVLFYMQAAVMFQDEGKVLKELRRFKRQHHSNFSKELAESVNLSIAFLELQDNLINEGELVYISDESFRHYYTVCADMLEEIEDDDSGTFDEWSKVFLTENLAYATALYAINPNLNERRRHFLLNKTLEYARICIDDIEKLELAAPIVENNDDVGIVLLYKAYVYRHMFNAYSLLGEREEAEKWLSASLKERKTLIRNYDDNSIDSKLYSSFQMEYYLNLLEYLEFCDVEALDEFEYMMYIDEIDDYISYYSNSDSVNVYFKKIVNQRSTIE